MSENANKSEDTFLTVEQAFDLALANLKSQSKDDERGKIYVWRQRFKEGNLSHKKIAGILEAAGFHKAVEERWISLDAPAVAEGLKESNDEAFPI